MVFIYVLLNTRDAEASKIIGQKLQMWQIFMIVVGAYKICVCACQQDNLFYVHDSANKISRPT